MGLNPVALTEVSTFTAAVQPPLAGSAVLAADVQAGEQALANRTLFLRDKINTPPVISGSGSVLTSVVDSFTTTSFVTATGIYFDVAGGCVVGDVLVFDMVGTADCYSSAAPGVGFLEPQFIQDYGGAATSIYGAGIVIPDNSATPTGRDSFAMIGSATIAVAGPCRVTLQGKVSSAAAPAIQLDLRGPYTLRVTHYKTNQ